MLFLFDTTKFTAHIIISVVGVGVLAAYTATTIKTWKIPALEIGMRASYGLALISGILIAAIHGVDAIVMDDSVLPHPQSLNLAERMERAVYLRLDEKNIVAKYVVGSKII